jgi:hypothetical protein
VQIFYTFSRVLGLAKSQQSVKTIFGKVVCELKATELDFPTPVPKTDLYRKWNTCSLNQARVTSHKDAYTSSTYTSGAYTSSAYMTSAYTSSASILKRRSSCCLLVNNKRRILS